MSLSNIEIIIGLVTVVLATIGVLMNAYVLAVLALVAGAVGFGMRIGGPRE